MSELEERLNAVLSDPEQMGRIAQMASRLMGSLPPQESGPPAAAAAPGPDAALLGLVSRLMGGMRGGGDKKQLLNGMAPYLAPTRRARLEKALRVAAAARLAGAALAEWGGGDEPV